MLDKCQGGIYVTEKIKKESALLFFCFKTKNLTYCFIKPYLLCISTSCSDIETLKNTFSTRERHPLHQFPGQNTQYTPWIIMVGSITIVNRAELRFTQIKTLIYIFSIDNCLMKNTATEKTVIAGLGELQPWLPYFHWSSCDRIDLGTPW